MSSQREKAVAFVDELRRLFELARPPASDLDAATAMTLAVKMIIDADSAWPPFDAGDAKMPAFRDLLSNAGLVSRQFLAGEANTGEWADAARALAVWDPEERVARA